MARIKNNKDKAKNMNNESKTKATSKMLCEIEQMSIANMPYRVHFCEPCATTTFFLSFLCGDKKENNLWGDPVNVYKDGGYSSNDYVFTGKLWDSESESYNLGKRVYVPQMRRFLVDDTINPEVTNFKGHNAYVYANNDPVNFFDPDGQEGVPYQYLIGTPPAGDGVFTSSMVLGVEPTIARDWFASEDHLKAMANISYQYTYNTIDYGLDAAMLFTGSANLIGYSKYGKYANLLSKVNVAKSTIKYITGKQSFTSLGIDAATFGLGIDSNVLINKPAKYMLMWIGYGTSMAVDNKESWLWGSSSVKELKLPDFSYPWDSGKSFGLDALKLDEMSPNQNVGVQQ